MRIRSTLTTLLVVTALGVTGCASDEPAENTENDAQNTAQQPEPERDPADSDEKSTSDDEGKDEPVESTPESLKFESTTVDGEPFDGASLAGKPTVLWFWAPWCPKCRAAAPSIGQAAKHFGDDVNIVGVAGLAEPADIEAFVEDYNLSAIPHLADENDPLWSKFGVDVQHTYVILDADGNEVHNGGLDDSELTAQLTDLTG